MTDDAATAVLDAIFNGEVDDYFDEIITAIRDRQRAMRHSMANFNKVQLTPGTRVVLKGLSPKYLNGLHGAVTGKECTRPRDLNVQLDPGQYTGRFASSVNVPASSLERETL